MKSTILTIAIAMMTTLAFAAEGDKKPEGKGKGGDPAARAEGMLKQMDTDKDGKVSKEEFGKSKLAERAKEKGGDEGVGKMFDRLDENKDGSLTKDELGKMGGKGKGPDGKGKPEGKGKGKPEAK